MDPLFKRGCTTILIVIAASACATAAPQGARPVIAAPVINPQSESAAIAQARADSLRHPYTEADVRFMSGMILHHAHENLLVLCAPTLGDRQTVQRHS